MEKKVIIFDLDGVLFDSVDLMHGLTQSQFVDLPLEFAIAMHKGNIHEELKKSTYERAQQTLEEKAEIMRVFREKKNHVLMYKGMKDLIVKLSEKYILTINTSAVLETSMPLLEREGLVSYFSYIATKEVSSSKVEKFKIISEKFNQPVEDMIFITDSVGDLREAAEVNLPTIAVTWGVHDNEYFSKETCTNLVATVHSVEELEHTILKQ